MKLTTKLLNLAAVAALSLGVAMTASAQTTTSLPVGVTLEREETALCQIAWSSSGSLGTWVWDETAGEYLHDPVASGQITPTLKIQGDITSMPALGCDITVAFGGLSNGTGDTIAPGAFEMYSWYEYWNDPDGDGDAYVPSAGWTHTGVTGATGTPGERAYDVDLTLWFLPTDLPEGTYTGNVQFTYSNAE